MSCSEIFAIVFAATNCWQPPMFYGPPKSYEPEALVVLAARFHNVPEHLALAMAETESNFNCSAVGKAGELGLFQVKPQTAFMMGFAGDPKQLKDCVTGAFYGVLHLRKALDSCGGNIPCAISRHNRGLKAKPKVDAKYVRKVQRKNKELQQ